MWKWLGVGLALLALPAGAVQLLGEHDIDPKLVGAKVLALFVVIATGLLFGRVRLKGIALGTAGVLFAGLACGFLGYQLPGGVGHLGLVLFVYAIGLTAGPTFFRAFAASGRHLAGLAVIMLLSSAVTAWAVTRLLDIPVDLAVGIFAGAMSSTPALAADNQALAEAGSRASIGFGIAYPFGVVCVVLAMQLLPRLLRVDLQRLTRELDQQHPDQSAVVRVLLSVRNPALFGRAPSAVSSLNRLDCAVTHQLVDDALQPIAADFRFESEQLLWVACRRADLDAVSDLLGKRADRAFHVDMLSQQREVAVTSRTMLDEPLGGLQLLKRYGVTVARVSRHDRSFVPRASTRLQYGDLLTAAGSESALEQFAKAAGHRPQATQETDLLSLAVGIGAGALLGMIPLTLPGGGVLELGLAGGPLLAGLLLGHFGKVGPIVGHMPPASRVLLNQLGLVLFLASAGALAGEHLVEVLREYGAMLLVAGALITLVPMAVGFVLARRLYKMNVLELMGVLSGGMTSSPGMGAISAQTSSDVPVVNYATTYPIALLITVATAQVLVLVLGG